MELCYLCLNSDLNNTAMLSQLCYNKSLSKNNDVLHFNLSILQDYDCVMDRYVPYLRHCRLHRGPIPAAWPSVSWSDSPFPESAWSESEAAELRQFSFIWSLFWCRWQIFSSGFDCNNLDDRSMRLIADGTIELLGVSTESYNIETSSWILTPSGLCCLFELGPVVPVVIFPHVYRFGI